MSKVEHSDDNQENDECENNLKRKFEEVAQNSDETSDDEDGDNLFLPRGLFVIATPCYIIKD